MSKKQIRIQKLIALHKCITGPKSANSKTVSYSRPTIDAVTEYLKGMLSDEGIRFMAADSKVGE